MRWLGIARRAHEIAVDRAAQREAFGSRLADLGMVQRMIADSAIDLHSSRALIWHTAWLLDTGAPAQRESSMTMVHVAEAVNRIVDRAVQICGSLGTSGGTPLAPSTPRSGRSGFTTAPPRRTAGRSPAAKSARGRAPSR
jgi:acyl-CoA dehydrogenase